MTLSNHTQAFPDLVSLEAWQSKPDDDGARSVHIDASFSEAKVGEDISSKVRFRLRLKRAEISFISSPTSGISIIQRSVAREISAKGTSETVTASNRSDHAKLEGAIEVSPTPKANVSISGASSVALDTATTTKLTKPIKHIEWSHRKDSAGNHCWNISAPQAGVLYGKPWDAVDEPRLRFKERVDGSDLDDPLRVKVSCRREDLDIIDPELKTKSSYEKMVGSGRRNRVAAAEAAIRCILEKEGLPLAEIEEMFSQITLAETIVTPEVE